MNEVIFPQDIQCSEYYNLCVSLITRSDSELQNRLRDIADHIQEAWAQFDLRITPKQLHNFEACFPPTRVAAALGQDAASQVIEPVIIAGTVSKDDLVRLYERYMVKGRRNAKAVYNLLRAASHNVCPLCGITKVSSLDHYLPKAKYPVFSINPKNLVPACDGCNKIKGDPIYRSESELHLYPYDDDAKYYNSDWVDASISIDRGVLNFDFYPNPPDEWSETEKRRAINHFETFELHAKYKNNATQLVTSIMYNIRSMLVTNDYVAVINYYLGAMEIVPANSTFRIMYKAVARDISICSGNF